MSFDGIVTRAVTKEMNDTILNGRINKVYQPFATDLILVVRAKGENHQLLLSANANFSRIQLTNEQYVNPQQPPMFCMLLRKHIEGSIIKNITQLGLDRIVHFELEARNEIGDIVSKSLIVEIMGRHSNIILIDAIEETIIDSIKQIPPFLNRYRTILPGRPYKQPPQQNKQNPLTASEEDILTKIDFNSGKIDRQLVQHFAGLSPLIGKEIVNRAKLATKESLPTAFLKLMTAIKNDDYTPEMVLSQAREAFSVIELTHVDGERTRFTSVSSLLDHFYFRKNERDRIKQAANDIERLLVNELKKNENKIKKLEKTLKQSKKADEYQLYGELLTAHMHIVKQHETSIRVENYYVPGSMVTIPLDPVKTPAENAQAYYKKYNKAKNAAIMVKQQLEKTKVEIDYFEQLLQQMDNASMDDVQEIREELEEEGYLRKKQRRKKKNNRPQPEAYVATDGIDILVGKNNRQNDFLTMRLASKSDTWLHAKDIPGSHVVVRGEPNEQTLKEAAMLAAYFSKAKDSSNVPVDFTLVRHVKKPNGAKPGFVTYDKQQTIYVTPKEKLVEQLRKHQ